MKQARWKEVHVGGKKKDKCVGSGNVKRWRKLKEEERFNLVRFFSKSLKNFTLL